MKKLLLVLAFLPIAVASDAQSVAQDWTKTDCDGNTWQLYPMCDSGKVVVMEFVMPTSCYGCHNAASYLEPIWQQFNASNPNKVEMFAIAYNNSYTCTQLSNWKTTYGINMMHPLDQGASMLSYYGSMGMPTIVIVGGVGHMVFYEKQGFTESDTTNIKNAISLALSTSSLSEAEVDKVIKVYPNPASDKIIIELTATAGSTNLIEMFNLAGEKIKTIDAGKEIRKEISISDLSAGVYFIRYNNGTSTYTKRIVKN
jgi:thiol-disulfide isomerase/thioredoxin